MKCFNCGYLLKDDALKCPNCGFIHPAYTGDKDGYEKMLTVMVGEYRKSNPKKDNVVNCAEINNKETDKTVNIKENASVLNSRDKEQELNTNRMLQEPPVKKKKTPFLVIGIIVIAIGVASIAYVTIQKNRQNSIDKQAQEQYEIAAESMQNGEYDFALSILQDIDHTWSDYSKIHGIIREIHFEKGEQELFEEALEYMQNGNYDAAISALEEIDPSWSGYSKVDNKMKEAMSGYKKDYLTRIDEYIRDEKFDEANTLIDEAMNVFENNYDFQAKKVEIENAIAMKEDAEDYDVTLESTLNMEETGVIGDSNSDKQVYLTDMTAYVGELYQCRYVNDNMGNEYSDCFIAFGSEESATYDLGRKYDKFTATLAITKAEVNEALFNDNYASIQIVGDNKVLYENLMIGIETRPIELELDVTGVLDLKITMKGKDTNLMYDNGLYVILANACLQKNN